MTLAPDRTPIAYQMAQPAGMVADVLVGGALDLASGRWIPQAEGVWFRPLLLNVSHGYYVNLLKVERDGILSRHRHTGPVHAFTLAGRWRYLEHDWTASAGDFAFEPPGETHTLVVEESGEPMVTLFHVTGGYVYVDPLGVAQGYEDVFTKFATARAHFDREGWPMAELDALIR